jgi:hypothetical protein
MADKGKNGTEINPFLNAAIKEAERDLTRSGTSIGSVLVHSG